MAFNKDFLTRQTNYKASHRALLLMKFFCLCTLGRCLFVRCIGMVLDEYGRLFPQLCQECSSAMLGKCNITQRRSLRW